MPRYNYHCIDCDEYFEIRHSMTESLENCTICDSQAFRRIPSIPTYINKINKSDRKVGSLVEEYIEKNKKSVAEEKKKLKKKEYKA